MLFDLLFSTTKLLKISLIPSFQLINFLRTHVDFNDRIGISSIGIEKIKDFYKAYPRLREHIPDLKIDLRDYMFKFPHN